jgi:hypothetical protein
MHAIARYRAGGVPRKTDGAEIAKMPFRMAEASVRLRAHHIAVTICACAAISACSGGGEASSARAAVPDSASTPSAPAIPAWLTPARKSEEDSIFRGAAAAAWRFAERNYVPATGFIKPFDTYSIGTMWDVGSGLGAMFCAAELGLLDRSEYDKRMHRVLRTLEQLPLFDDVGFNKEYSMDGGRLIGIERVPASRGYGISATDNGRFLLWLRIIANRNPQHAAIIQRIVKRMDLDAFEDDGYLIGRQLSRRTGRMRKFQEGRIGYEQYAASGYRAWGMEAEQALDITANARMQDVSGIRLPADRRGSDRLTSEPFVLLGLEAGWSESERAVAQRVLAAQVARYKSTGSLTMVSEDAIDIAPDYFFYYTVLSKHGPWTVDVQRPGAKVTGPRWLSTKAAFAWHALLPSDYTRLAVDTVRARALVDGVWGSGVFESGRPTATPNINTAAVVLESALYRQYGGPLIRGRS